VILRTAAIAAALVAIASCRRPPEPASEPSLARSADPAALSAWSERIASFSGDRLDHSDRSDRSEEKVSLVSLLPADRPVLIAFWATYCPPCIEEMPSLEVLAKQGRAIVGVSMDSADAEKARAVLAKMGASYPNLVLDEASMKAAGLAFERGLPFSVVSAGGTRAVELLFGGVEGADVEAALVRASRLPRP
jgi:thiol-disulfide isomerase/thioredoxin